MKDIKREGVIYKENRNRYSRNFFKKEVSMRLLDEHIETIRKDFASMQTK